MRRFIAAFLCGLLVTSITPLSISATNLRTPMVEPMYGVEYKENSQSPSTQELEKAIRTIKSKINIPKEYSQFDYYYAGSSYYSDVYWQLTWRDPLNHNFIQVNCDQNYRITYFAKIDYSNNGGIIPTNRKHELKSKADEFIKTVVPEVYKSIRFVDSEYEGIYSNSYVYRYERVENEVVFPDNSVYVSVNGTTGEIRRASINWLYDVEIPNSKVKINLDEATGIISEHVEMKLVYRTNYNDWYQDRNKPIKAYLVYEPNLNYISVDAKTGAVYLSKSEWIQKDDKDQANMSRVSLEKQAMDTSTGALTDEEIARLEELNNLISKDKAIEIIINNRYLLIDKGIKSYSATLNKILDSAGKEAYVWDINLKDPTPIDYNKETNYYRAYANAQVDAKTGRILSFYASPKSYYNEKKNTWESVKITFDKEHCRKTLEAFLKLEMKNQFENSKLVDKIDDYIAYYKDEQPIYGGYSYHYQRINEGTLFPYNGIHGAVDGITGKIYSFYSNWDHNIVFESPKGVITPEKAFEYYIALDTFQLVYESNEVNIYSPNYGREGEYFDYSKAYSKEYEIRLVYRPDIYPYYISPFTGRQLDFDGEVFKIKNPISYLDIEDQEDNKLILLLADMNIGFEGDYFYPDKHITIGELTYLLDSIYYGGYKQIEEANATKLINREEMAHLFIQKLGLDKVAKIQGIYYTGYWDQDQIKQEYLGSVALAKGLEIMTSDDRGMFYPKDYVTRRSAIQYIIGFLNAQNNFYY